MMLDLAPKVYEKAMSVDEPPNQSEIADRVAELAVFMVMAHHKAWKLATKANEVIGQLVF